jgi:transcriptional regulator
MYVPAHFKPDDASVSELLRQHGAADLISSTANGLLASFIPFIYDAPGTRPDVGRHGSLVGHVARNNIQWREPALGDSLVIVRGPDSYVSPGWYATKREHGRVVPTWNYITAHAYGRLVIHDDADWVEALVRRLTTKHEAGQAEPWSVDDAPAPYVQGQLRAIVGVELLIDRLEGKWKLSQNRSEADVAGVIDGMEADGKAETAAVVRTQADRRT